MTDLPREPIDFASLAAALLDRIDQLVPQWLPGGRRNGIEYECADLSGGQGTSCKVNMVNGAWADFAADDRGGDLISLYGAIHGCNNGKAAHLLKQEMGWLKQAATPAPRQSSRPPEPPPEDHPEKRRSMWRAIVPVPSTAPVPDMRHWQRGQPEAFWEYKTDGALVGYVCRYITSDGGKDILPLTWCVDESDGRGLSRWHNKQWDEPRPLYLPAGSLGEATRTVLVVEGEKCALAAHQALTDYDAVSWPGGGKAWDKAGWQAVAGRTVVLWADCDAKHEKLTKAERESGVDQDTKPLLPESKQPGVVTMQGLGLHLAGLGCTVSVCPLPAPGAVADGWDVADAIAQGWTVDQLKAFLAAAKPLGAEPAQADQPHRPAGASRDERETWHELLLRTEKNGVKAVRENIVLALDGLPSRGVRGAPEAKGVIAYNEFTNDVIKLKAAPWGTPAGTWAEVDELKMGQWLAHDLQLPPMPRTALEEAVRIVAYNHRFHPVQQYLNSLKWDGIKRLSTWIRRACLEEDEWDDADPLQQYLARVGTFYLQGMCARAMEPGVKFDWMLILEGAQGMRKSTVLRTLAGEYFADTGLVLGDKDSYQQLQGRWLYEFGELDSFGKTEVTKIKSFIASSSDYFRASFDRRARDYPRQLVFAGTTNEDHYLTDPTGNRRFWPVRVTRIIDVDWVQENRDQLFAEAMVRVAEGRRMYPTAKEEIELFQPQQQQRAVENAIDAKIGQFLYDEKQVVTLSSVNGTLIKEISLVDLLSKIGIGIEKLGPGRFHEKQAAAAMRRLGWVERRSSAPGRPRVYCRPASNTSTSTAQVQSHQPASTTNDCPF